MKKILSAIAACGFLLSSCDNMSGFFKNETDVADSANAQVDYVSTRDMSITPENAYSDIFLDSSALENFISREKVAEAEAKEIRSFYNSRNYQYAWFSSEGLTEQGRNFWNIYDSNIDTVKVKINKQLDQQMDSLLTNDSLMIQNGDSAYAKTELQITREFVRYARNNKDMSQHIYAMVPVKKTDPLQLTDSFLNKMKDTSHFSGNRRVTALRSQLSRYNDIAKKGGWQPITLGAKQIRKGTTSPAVTSIKRRLQASGDYMANDTTAQFNDSLEVAIRSYQERHGFKPDGVVTDSLVQTMNIPVEVRMQQILMNMNRMIWSPVNQNHDQLIEVNIPAFMLHVYENNQKAFDMNVVVGKEGSNTTMFTGNLNQIVFSPYWNIPASIVKNEIMPALKKDPNYLKKKNMEIVKQQGDVPQIRQLPGNDNSLGKVKFLFPNSFDIYFHDTPAKGLFNQANRAYSHGCIRLEDAQKMAQYLLRNQSEWTPEKIQEAMNSNKEQYVKLQKPVPVVINYFTAWADENGQMHFRNDIYKHDEKTARRMFTGNTANHLAQQNTIPNQKDSANQMRNDSGKRKVTKP